MIVVDSSVFLAVLLQEPAEQTLTNVLSNASDLVMSAGNYIECAMVAVGRGIGGRDDLDAWLKDQRIAVEPVDLALAQLAADAFARYGKGRHPAALNYGDCFAYGLAKSLRAPLLYKGADFGRTDIVSALA